MADPLDALDAIKGHAVEMARAATSSRLKYVPPDTLQPIATSIAKMYFELVRPLLEPVATRAGLVEEIDWVVQSLLQLATGRREKQAYLGHIKELHPLLMEATIDLMKARGARTLVLSHTERNILETLGKMLPASAASYEQALRDISQGGRVSWRGTSADLRETIREVIDHLAPDAQVAASNGFRFEQGQTQPTQKQKVRFILRARHNTSAAVTVAEASLNTVDEAVATLARTAYQRSSVSTHVGADAREIRNLKRYVDALLGELLEVT